MKKLESLGRSLNKNQQKKIIGGTGTENCCSTCWINTTEELGSVEVPDCSYENGKKCKDTYPQATKATCVCDTE